MDTTELYDEAPCGLLVTRADGSIVRVNATLCRWLDQDAAALLGRRFQDLLATGARIFHQTHWAPLMQLQGSVAEVKLMFAHRSGRDVPIVVNAVRRGEGEAARHEIALFMAEDRHAYERELLVARRRAEQAAEEQERARTALKVSETLLRAQRAAAEDRALLAEQMIGIVSHDLRNPLAAILMGASALERSALPDPHGRFAHHILESARRARRMIEDLLDFTSARMGRGIAVSQHDIDLHETVAGCVDELRRAHHPRDILHVREGNGACSADPDRLYQLIGNLVSNAVAYGAPDAPVTVYSRVGGAGCAVAVHNRGPAIPPESLPTLFQPLVRGADGGSARSIGLGLYIVAEIARAHGGGVEVASDADAGTTFTMRWQEPATAFPGAMLGA